MFRAAILLFTISLAACDAGQKAPLVAADVVVYQSTPGNRMRVGYFSLTNNSEMTITIDRVTSEEFAAVEMHETQYEDGIAKMRPLPFVSVPPGETIRFEKGGKHLMLMKPTEQTDDVTLRFYSDDALLMSVVAAPLQAGGQ